MGGGWVVNFRIRFSLLGLNEMFRSAEQSYVSHPPPIIGYRSVIGANLQKHFLLGLNENM